jgi:1-phosphatidylinositol-4-phosphate 5-kinase
MFHPQVHGRTVRFVVMSNIFCTDLQIHKKFDLKVCDV